MDNGRERDSHCRRRPCSGSRQDVQERRSCKNCNSWQCVLRASSARAFLRSHTQLSRAAPTSLSGDWRSRRLRSTKTVVYYELPRPTDIRRPPLAAVRNGHLATFPDADTRAAAGRRGAPSGIDGVRETRLALEVDRVAPAAHLGIHGGRPWRPVSGVSCRPGGLVGTLAIASLSAMQHLSQGAKPRTPNIHGRAASGRTSGRPRIWPSPGPGSHSKTPDEGATGRATLRRRAESKGHTPFEAGKGGRSGNSSLSLSEVWPGIARTYELAKKYNIKTAWGTDVLFSQDCSRHSAGAQLELFGYERSC
jgi:hypothetical protein